MVFVAAMVIFGGTACSSSGTGPAAAGKPEVATLQSAGASPSATPASSAAQAPRERIDGTAADFEALVKPYDDCMKSHGLGGKGLRLSDSKMPSKVVADAAEKECRPKYPLPPWELDPANPEAKDFARAVVQCLKAKGVKYVEVNPDGPGWSFGGPQNDAQSISKGMELSPACEREVAAKK
jgi:hypothetical protein